VEGERNTLLVASPKFTSHTAHLEQLQRAILKAADAGRRVAECLHRQEDGFSVGDRRFRLSATARLFVIGLGKAAPAMSTATASALGRRMDRGIAAVPRGTPLRAPARMTYFPAGHPQPDEGSLACGQAVEAMLTETMSEDVVLALVSGGGSAMLEIPVPGIGLPDLQSLNAALIRSGAPIQEINVVRGALSRIKSGGLARLAAPAQTVAMILSDVVGDRLSSIASGPTVLRRAAPHRAVRVLERYNLWKGVPQAIQDALAGERPPPTPAPRPVNILIGSNRLVIEAAQAAAAGMGFPVRVLSRRTHGEAREVGIRMAAAMAGAIGPQCLIMGGETTVRVSGTGRGGRNQELALAAAIRLDGLPRAVLISLATDGVDGPTDASGAVVTGETAARARQLNLDLHAALADNDAYPCLDRLGALIRTGPTGTNLNDVVVGLVYPT
jgi:glycerate 2-kinase